VVPIVRRGRDAAAADGGQLVPVAEERDGGVGSVGDCEESAGGVLVEHAGFVDEQDVAGQQPSAGLRVGLDARPVTVLVPPEAVLVDEPRRGERVGADLLVRC
jgi:hypothetical protein